jgi:hypothetical protein
VQKTKADRIRGGRNYVGINRVGLTGKDELEKWEKKDDEMKGCRCGGLNSIGRNNRGLKAKEELLDWEEDDDYMEEFSKEDVTTVSTANSSTVVRPHIVGPSHLRKCLTTLCEEFSELFATEVSSQPAKVPPMELHVDESLWYGDPVNRIPPRPQNSRKQEVVREQVELLLKLGVIQPSTASAHSQVNIVPKPGTDKWRFTNDFRRLNLATLTERYPLPLIGEMLRRIGMKKARFFGQMDMTSGYWQFMLHPNSRHYTAFITVFGLFEWTRVAMGLKGAGAFFQRMMVMILSGLLYNILEVYMDDIFVYGRTEQEFIDNLTKTFNRLRKYNVKLNPSKTFLGLTTAELCGHEISAEGIHFSAKKLRLVEDFKTPVTPKELQSF